jgi:hypothetical protein
MWDLQTLKRLNGEPVEQEEQPKLALTDDDKQFLRSLRIDTEEK